MDISVSTSRVIVEVGVLTEQYAPSALDRPNTFVETTAEILTNTSPEQIDLGSVNLSVGAPIRTNRQQYYVSPPSSFSTSIFTEENDPTNFLPISVTYEASPNIVVEYPRRIRSPNNVHWDSRIQGPQSQVYVADGTIAPPVFNISSELALVNDKDRNRFVYGAANPNIEASRTVYTEAIPSSIDLSFQMGQSYNIAVSYDYSWASTQSIPELRPSAAEGTTTNFKQVNLIIDADWDATFPSGVYSNQNGPITVVYGSTQFAAEPALRPTSIVGGLEDISSPTGITATSRAFTGTGFGILNPDAGVYARVINTKLNPQREGIAFKIKGEAISRRYLRVCFDYYKGQNNSAYEGEYPHVFDAIIGISNVYNGIPFQALGDTPQSFPDLNHDARAQLRRRFTDYTVDSEEYSAILLSNGAQTADVRSREDSTNNTYTNMTIFDYQNTSSLTDFFPAPNETSTDKTNARIVYLIDFQTGDQYFFCRNKYLKPTLELICSENTGLTSYDQNKDTYLLWGLSPFAYDNDCFLSNVYINQIQITMADTWDTVNILTDPMAEPTGNYSNISRSWEQDEESPDDLLSADQQAGIESTIVTPVTPRIDVDISKMPAFSPGTVYMYPQVKIAINQEWQGDLFSNKARITMPKIGFSIGNSYARYPTFSSGSLYEVEIYTNLPIQKPEIESIYLYKQQVPLYNNKRVSLPVIAHSPAILEVAVEAPLIETTIEDNAVIDIPQSKPIVTSLNRYANEVNNFNVSDIFIDITNIDYDSIEIGSLNFGSINIAVSYDRYDYYFIATQPRVSSTGILTVEPGEDLVFFQDRFGVTRFGLESDFVELPAGAGSFSSFELLISE